MRVELLTLCESAKQEGPCISITKAFNDITVPAIPCIIPLLHVASRLVFELEDSGQRRLELAARDTRGQVLCSTLVGLPLPTELFRPHTTAHLIFQLQNMQIQSGGEHVLTLELDGKPAHQAQFWVSRAK